MARTLTEDETKLWKKGRGGLGHDTAVGKTSSDGNSVDSLEEQQYPGKVGRSTVVTAWGQNNARSGGGINVTRETKVSYADN